MNNQDALTNAISAASMKAQDEEGPDLRHLHPKSHGLLHGEFKVSYDIPAEYKIGVFATPQTYPIWVRFSNGSSPKARGVLQPDTVGDVRGMAIKLMNIPGDKVLDDETGTQDFILVNHPVFFLPDVQGYINFATFKKLKTQLETGGNLEPEQSAALKQLKETLEPSFAIVKAMNGKIVGNPLLFQYWSTTPYKFGSHKIKFLVKPHKPEQPPTTAKSDSPNYLREAIVKYFNDTEESVKFDFQIQVYVDDEKTPIENPMVEWKETDSSPITVATIEISKQAFDFEERKRYDDSLSFSPWHTLPEHEPLGSVNLARKQIYQEGAKHRREYIQERLREPQPYQSIQDDPHTIE
jgi:catalase